MHDSVNFANFILHRVFITTRIIRYPKTKHFIETLILGFELKRGSASKPSCWVHYVVSLGKTIDSHSVTLNCWGNLTEFWEVTRYTNPCFKSPRAMSLPVSLSAISRVYNRYRCSNGGGNLNGQITHPGVSC